MASKSSLFVCRKEKEIPINKKLVNYHQFFCCASSVLYVSIYVVYIDRAVKAQ